MWIESMTESGSRRFSTRFGDVRTVMNGSTMAIRPCRARAVTAEPLASRVGAVPGSSSAMRVSILPPSRPLAAMVSAS